MYRKGLYPEVLPPLVRRLLYLTLWVATRSKWFVDRRFLPLHTRDWLLYLDIHVISFLRLRSFPNFRNPKSLNDQIRWTMLFSQNRRMPELCDKLAVRTYVRDKIGENYLIPLIAHGSWEEVSKFLPSSIGMLKCTHDSGSALLVDYPDSSEITIIREKFLTQLGKQYGVGKGEWPYGLVMPNLIYEELLPGTEKGISPPDVKVHCIDGEPMLYEVIVGRQLRPQGSLFLPDGSQLQEHFRDDRLPLESFPIDRAISLLEEPARELAEGLRYVRVDFYLTEDCVFFGEMTFFPESGLFTTPPGVDTSRLLSIPCSEPSESIYDSRIQQLL